MSKNYATSKGRTALTLLLAEKKSKGEQVSAQQVVKEMEAAGYSIVSSTVKTVANSLDYPLLSRTMRRRGQRQVNNIRRVRGLAHCVRALFLECGVAEPQLLKALCAGLALDGYSLRNAYPSGKYPSDVDGTLFQNLTDPGANGTP